ARCVSTTLSLYKHKRRLSLTLSSSSENGQVITIHWAYFGRRDTTTCSYQRPDTEIQNVHCLNPTPKVCNGKSSCAIEASCSVFGDPCPGTYKYLEVAYDCQCKCLQTPLITCEHSYANLQCGEGKVIVVLWAEYGRRDSTTCSYKRPPSQLENIHCSNPTSKVTDSCNGRNSCSIKVRNSVFGDPCPGTYKYLEVVYDCQPDCSSALVHV
uniref:SUEL-type lectin domain-containing protein n=1 Tax=Amphilophus citrinellus TaxID=61819 RepID=A0A3Q0RPR1_AMPCI